MSARIAVLSLGLLLLAGCSPEKPELHARKERLGVVPEEWREITLRVSDDGRHWAIADGREGDMRIVRDGQAGPTYPQLSEPTLAPETARMAYWALPDDPGARGLLLVADGQPMTTEIARPGRIVFSENGEHWVVAGGVGLGDPFARDEEGKPILPTRGPVVVLHDGREIGRHSDTSLPALDATGTHVAYLARDEADRVMLVVDGEARPPFEQAPGAKPPTIGENVIGPTMDAWYAVRWLDDGSILTVADHPDGWAVRRDGEVLGAYAWAAEPFPSGVEPTPPEGLEEQATFIPKSMDVAPGAPVAVWWERPAGPDALWRVVRNGEPVDDLGCRRPWERQRPLLSDDGAHVAYVCAEPEPMQMGDVVPREHMWVVHDGQRLGPYPAVWGLALSPDGAHVAYAAAESAEPEARWRYHRDGLPVGRGFRETWPVRFGPDGRRLAWEARGDDDVTRLMFEDVAVASFDQVLWGPSFLGPDMVAWVIRRGKELWRIEAWVGDETPPEG